MTDKELIVYSLISMFFYWGFVFYQGKQIKANNIGEEHLFDFGISFSLSIVLGMSYSIIMNNNVSDKQLYITLGVIFLFTISSVYLSACKLKTSHMKDFKCHHIFNTKHPFLHYVSELLFSSGLIFLTLASSSILNQELLKTPFIVLIVGTIFIVIAYFINETKLIKPLSYDEQIKECQNIIEQKQLQIQNLTKLKENIND